MAFPDVTPPRPRRIGEISCPLNGSVSFVQKQNVTVPRPLPDIYMRSGPRYPPPELNTPRRRGIFMALMTGSIAISAYAYMSVSKWQQQKQEEYGPLAHQMTIQNVMEIAEAEANKPVALTSTVKQDGGNKLHLPPGFEDLVDEFNKRTAAQQEAAKRMQIERQKIYRPPNRWNPDIKTLYCAPGTISEG